MRRSPGAEALLVLAAALLAGYALEMTPREPLLLLMRKSWWDWTWTLNLAARVISLLFLVLGLWRYFRTGRRSPLVIFGLSSLLFVGFMLGATTSYEAQPIRLADFLIYLGTGALGLEFARLRKRK